MERIQYIIQVHGQSRPVTKGYTAEVPRYLTTSLVSDAELKALFQRLFLERWDSLVAEQGPFGCLVCGERVTLIKNWPLREPDKILDLILPICRHGNSDSFCDCIFI